MPRGAADRLPPDVHPPVRMRRCRGRETRNRPIAIDAARHG
jgi:hypothetical protein